MYTFVKEDIPVDEVELVAFTEKLFTFGVSINDYKKAFILPEITVYVSITNYKEIFTHHTLHSASTPGNQLQQSARGNHLKVSNQLQWRNYAHTWNS